MIKKAIVAVGLILVIKGQSQNPQNLAFPNSQPNPVPSATNLYSRASESIHLNPGFNFKPVSGLLNLNISSYPAYVNNSYKDPATQTGYFFASPGLEAAVINGEQSVDRIGGFNYNIPIVCSPGTAGMEPKLTISYGSGADNTWLGLGFNISGISKISRAGKSLFYDGIKGGIKLNSNDVYSLDGARLLIKSGTYGSANSAYKKEVEDYSTITAVGVFGSGPQYFIVTTPGGLTMEYGRANSSRHTDQANAEALEWYINKIYDESGNYMLYHYKNSGGEILIDKIEYTGNGSLSPYNKILFEYIERSDENTYNIEGKIFSRKHILRSIVCKDMNNAVVRSYDLGYQYSLASLLNRITETDATGNSLNPTFFEWKKEGRSPDYHICSLLTTHTAIDFNRPLYEVSIPADLNGDGKKDLVLLRMDGSLQAQFKLNLGKMANCFFPPSAPIDFYTDQNLLTIQSSQVEYITSFVFDEDFDNTEEVFVVYAEEVSSSFKYTIEKIKNVGGSFVKTTEFTGTFPLNTRPPVWRFLKNFHVNGASFNRSSLFYMKEDVTGDNLKDVIHTNQGDLIVVPSNGQPAIITPLNHIIKTGLGDFDGDGILDIYVLRSITAYNPPYICEVYKYDPGNNTLNLAASVNINTGTNPYIQDWEAYNDSQRLNNYANGSKSVDFGDFDGDGKTDIMYINYIANSSNGNVHILRSNGLTFLADNDPLTVPVMLNGSEANFMALDVNNDGYADLMVNSHNVANGTTNFDYYASNGNFLTPAAGTQTYSDAMLGCLADFNGDGALDYIYQPAFVDFQVTFSAFNQNNRKLVERVFNIKDDIKIKYQYLPGEFEAGDLLNINDRRYYAKSAYVNSDPAFKPLKPALFVVTHMESNDRIFKYGYENSVYNPSGKGFLGFERTYSQDQDRSAYPIYRGTVTTSTYNALFDEEISQKVQETYLLNLFTVDASKNSASRETILNYVQSGSNRYLQSRTVATRDYLSSRYNVSSLTFDHNSGGQILSAVSENRKWLTQQVINSSQENYTYQSLVNAGNGSTYYRPLKTTLIRSANGTTSTYVSDFTYDGPTGALKKVVKNSNHAALAITTDYSQFNQFGEALNISVTAPDLAQAKTMLLQYDATGRFVTQETNALGHTLKTQYEPAYGNVTQLTDASGLVTRFSYDGLGRKIRTISPAGAVNTVSYEWHTYLSSHLIPQQRYGIKVTNTSERDGSEASYYSNRDLIMKTEATGFGGNTIVKGYEYDKSGRLTAETEPYFQNQPVFKKMVYLYDLFDRPQRIEQFTNSNATLKTVNYSYNALSDSSTYKKGFVKAESAAGNGSGTIYKSIENNEAGQIDRVVNYENSNAPHTSDYTFNEHGLPLQVVNSFPGGQGGSTSSLTYDALGRRKSLSDPSAGLHTYDYNSIGELMQESTPNGQYTYVYDVAGRLISKTGSGSGTYTYDYVTSGNGLAGLKKITGPSATTEFLYDSRNRITEKKESIGTGLQAKQFKTSFTYDKFDRIVDHVYPGNFRTTNEYDSYGNLVRIKNNTTTLWELAAMKTPELVQEYKNGAGISTVLGYDTKLNLRQIDLGNISSQTFNINTATGNILERTHRNFVSNTDNYEGFDYDNFDRLIRTKYKDVNNTIQTKQNFTYMANGNFAHKDDCGDYVYGNAGKPYQLTQIQNATNNISLNTLNITHNDLDKVSQITEATSNKKFDFVYGNTNERIKMEYRLNNQLQYTRYYLEEYDREESPAGFREWSYINSPAGLAAVYYNDNGAARLLNVTTDNQGSPVLLTNSAGQVLEEYSFDAWGRRRNPGDWSYTGVAAPQLMIRGYTGHEHLDEVGLINMNGRVYDPVLGRFIQPDPYIQSPADLQNFNRYSYVLNNPLKYTDPTGYKIGYQSPYVGKGTSYIGSDGYSMFDQGRIDNNLTEFDRETAQAGLDAGRYSSGGPAAGGGGGIGVGAKGGGKKGTGTGQNARSNDKLGSAATMPSFDSPVVEIIAEKTQRPNQNNDKFGFFVSTVDVGVGFYTGHLYNHTTYRTTQGRVMDIYRANGTVRSARAATYARYSKYVTRFGTSISVLSMSYSLYKISKGTATTMEKIDFGVGAFGLGASAAAAFGIISNPVGWGIGVGVSIYGGARLLGDVIGDYNPGRPGVGQFYDYSTGTYMIK